MPNNLIKRPLVYVAILFCLGVIAANMLRAPLGVIYPLAIMSALFSLLLIKKPAAGFIFLSFSIFLLGAVSLLNSQALPACHIAGLDTAGHECVVRGFINSDPQVKNNKVYFMLKPEEIHFNNLSLVCCGDALVYAPKGLNFEYGEELVLKAALYRRRRNYTGAGAAYPLIRLGPKSAITRINKGRAQPLKKLAFGLKAKLKEALHRHLSGISASILDAMLLGDKKSVPPALYNLMAKSGTVHILVVSGFHVGIVSLIILLFLKLFSLPYKARVIAAAVLLLAYSFITGAATSVVRATIMAIIFLFSYLFKRQADIYNSCAAAALFILMIKPEQLFDIGFQLSFASVISIVYLYPRLNSFLRIDSLKLKGARLILQGCLVSVSAWLGTLVFVAYYFKIFSPVTVLANILIVPLAGLITLCGFSLLLASFIMSGLAPYFAATCELIAAILVKTAACLVKLPFAYLYLA